MTARRRRRRIVRVVVQVLSVVLVGYLITQELPEIRDAIGAIGRADTLLLLLAVVMEVGAVLTLPQVYRASLRVVDRDLPYRSTLELSMSAFVLGRVLPGGGVAGAVYAGRRLTVLGIDGVASAATVGIQGTGQLASLGVLCAAVSARAAFRGDVEGPLLGLVAVAAALVAVVPFVVSRLARSTSVRATLDRLVGRVAGEDRRGRFSGWVVELAALPLSLRHLAVIGVWACINWLFEFAALWLCLIALGGNVKAGVLMLGFGAANLLMGLPHVPGGVGFVEAGMSGTFIALGVDPPLAIGTVLLYRVVAFWLPVIAGLVVYLRTRGKVIHNGTTTGQFQTDGGVS